MKAKEQGTVAKDSLHFISAFPFSAELLRLFSENDLMEEGLGSTPRPLNVPPLLLTLKEPEIHSCLNELSLGRRKWVWRELRAWKEEWKGRLQPRGKRKKKQTSVTTATGKPVVVVSEGSSDASSSSSDFSASEDEEKSTSKSGSAKQTEKKSPVHETRGSSTKLHVSGNAVTSSFNGNINAISCLNCLHRGKHALASTLEPERWKTFIAFLYVLLVSWLSAFVMVIVHDRVPDMEKYPPLPDLFLDNLPHIPWAFEMCELTGMVLLTLWALVCIMHKHRFILMRRFFSISGTIFLLRCVTMLITSLSVPGKHLACAPRPYGDIWNKLYNAYIIWTGAGMTLQGVRTCGDYMFSGHTVSLTLLNFFITEYTSRRIYFLATLTWICNVFGIFFILAAHEHYSIDVFIAFYISSRLFLYYHTLANNKGGGKISQRAWFYFPLFYFFESNIEGKIPNEFEWPLTLRDVQDYAQKIWRPYEDNESLLAQEQSSPTKKQQPQGVKKKKNK